MSDRKSPVRLTNAEMYVIYKYCIEHMCISQIENAISYRVDKKKIAQEINLLGRFKQRQISASHITSAVECVVEWQEMLGQKITVQESAELEQLKIYKIKTAKQLAEYELSVDGLTTKNIGLLNEIERLKKPSDAQNILDRIRLLVNTSAS